MSVTVERVRDGFLVHWGDHSMTLLRTISDVEATIVDRLNPGETAHVAWVGFPACFNPRTLTGKARP